MKKITLLIIVAFTLFNIGANAQNLIEDWDANGAIGTGTEANKWGWGSTFASAAWGEANGGGVRFVDLSGSSNPVHYLSDNTTVFTGRAFLYRWDGSYWGSTLTLGSGDGSGTTVSPIALSGCSSYIFSGLFEWWNNGAQPTYSVSIGTEPTGGTIIATTSLVYPTSVKNRLYAFSYTFYVPTAGNYYIIIKQANGTGSGNGTLIGLANLSLVANTSPFITVNPESVALSDVTKSVEITVSGTALPGDVAISAPAGITLSRTSIPVGETPCGGKVTVTYDYSQPITSGKIMFTSDTYKDSVSFTYTPPSISIYERKIEVENNGKPYPLNVKSIGNSVDSLFVSASSEFSVVKNSYSADDFTSGSGSINVDVNSSASIGSTGKLIFYTKQASVVIKLDSVNVEKVPTYTRYYIKNSVGGLIVGDNSNGLYPELTAKNGYAKEKFYIRKVNIDPGATPDTFYIVQDSTYRVIRKVANSNWNTEFGVPSNEAKWTRQVVGAPDTFYITNVVTAKLVGTNATTAGERLYDDKLSTDVSYKKWIFEDASVPTGIKLDKELAVIKVYPTVTNGSFTVATPGKATITVYDYTGKIVTEQTAQSSITNININVKAGIYMVKVKSEGFTKVSRILITN